MAARIPGLPRPRISRSQLALARPPDGLAESLTPAILPGLARPQHEVAADSQFRKMPGTAPSAVWEFSPALWLLPGLQPSLAQPFCVRTGFLSFAIFSFQLLVLASGSRIFSVFASSQSLRAFRSVSALPIPRLRRQTFSAVWTLQSDVAIPLETAIRPFRSSSLLSPVSLFQLGWAILLLLQKQQS